MKKHFPGYFPPSEKEIKARWATAIIALDASFLLGLYDLTPVVRRNVLAVLRPLRSRLFVANKAAEEFLKNRRGRIKRLRDHHDEIAAALRNPIENLTRRGQKIPTLSKKTVGLLREGLKAAESEINKSRAKGESLFSDDSVQSEVDAILDGRIGVALDEKALKEIYKEGQSRYAQKIPPGYKDGEKPEPDRYGDLVIWKEILLRGAKQHVFFVTWDEKEDWWWIFDNEKLGARAELVEEALKNGLLSFHIYTGDRFLENARKFANARITTTAIKEVKEANTGEGASSKVLAALGRLTAADSASAYPTVASYLAGADLAKYAAAGQKVADQWAMFDWSKYAAVGHKVADQLAMYDLSKYAAVGQTLADQLALFDSSKLVISSADIASVVSRK